MKSSYTVSNCVGLSSLIAESIIAGNKTQSFDGKEMYQKSLGNHLN